MYLAKMGFAFPNFACLNCYLRSVPRVARKRWRDSVKTELELAGVNVTECMWRHGT